MKIVVQEDPRYTREYLEPDKRSIANAVQIFFANGTSTEKIEVEYPIGHRRRRKEGIPLLVEKFKAALARRFSGEHCHKILNLFENPEKLQALKVDQFVGHFLPE